MDVQGEAIFKIWPSLSKEVIADKGSHGSRRVDCEGGRGDGGRDQGGQRQQPEAGGQTESTKWSEGDSKDNVEEDRVWVEQAPGHHSVGEEPPSKDTKGAATNGGAQDPVTYIWTTTSIEATRFHILIKKNTDVELRMIVLEERSGVVSPTKTSGVPEQIVVASFYVCQFFAMCILLPPLSFLRSSAIVVSSFQHYLVLPKSIQSHCNPKWSPLRTVSTRTLDKTSSPLTKN